MTDLFTSVAATNAVARRMAREVGKNRDAYLERLGEVISRTHYELILRGKMRRDELRPAMNHIVTQLSSTANVIDVEVSHAMRKKLASDETINCRMIVAYCSDSADVFDFISLELVMTRRDLRLRFDIMDFSATTHVLSRFMQRGRTEPLRFFRGMQKSLGAAAMLTPMALRVNGRVVVPHDRGLLFGDAEHMDLRESSEDPPLFPLTRHFNKRVNSNDTLGGEDARALRAVCRARTYIDGDSLTGHRATLLEMLEAWQDEHSEGIMAMWEACAFGSARIRIGQTQDSIKDAILRAQDAAEKVVKSSAWARLAGAEGGGK